MKAAVLHGFGENPRYEEFRKPNPGEGEILIRVKAVALENIDKAMAKGTHFASRQFLSELPAIVGFDGVGETPDGRLVGFGGVKAPFGAMAEWTVVPSNYTVPIPDGVDAITAASVPSSALTALFPLKWVAGMKSGETVLINGATGVSGKLAVQIAKMLGAGRIVGTGRNPESMKRVLEYGADAVIDLKQPQEELTETFRREAGEGYDVILDFLWGSPTEALIRSMVPDEIRLAGKRTRLVQIGEKAGETIALSAEMLRTTGLEIYGGAAGLTGETMQEGTNMVWDWLKEDKLRMDVDVVELRDIERIWQRKDFEGKRIVIVT
ncbi:quinone oxidoreductase family protein [Cohnella sp. 56]|uniref:quinone oxidoreductase family protein n=1 Tax=Cohnella sp. 56 TaxID=3113722 RepID=UPI0030E8F4C6